MLLAFWYARNESNDQVSMVARTKKDLMARLESFGGEGEDGKPLKDAWKAEFAEPEKRVVIYKDGHELMTMAAGEGGGFYGASMSMKEFEVRYPEIYAKQ